MRFSRGEYDLLHLHAMAPGCLHLYAGIGRIPIVATIHGLDWRTS